jgi:Serine dehydrogenase proteinase
MMPEIAELESLLARLQASRGNPVLLCHSMLASDLVPVLYRCVHRLGRGERLDLVLSTYGGAVTSTRQIALLLREFTDRLTILVPQRARSAGTLLCLAADELVLSPFAELGPLDANMGATEAQAPGTPGILSAEDIRAFPGMAHDWFGVQRPEDGLQLLAMLSQRIFPASLSAFYRQDKLIRQVAEELLAFQLPAEEQLRARIVDQLVSGYHAHDYVLTPRDAQRLGLRTAEAGPDEQELLWSIGRQLCRPELNRAGGGTTGDGPAVEVAGIIASAGFLACNLIRRRVGADGSLSDSGQAEWEINGG